MHDTRSDGPSVFHNNRADSRFLSPLHKHELVVLLSHQGTAEKVWLQSYSLNHLRILVHMYILAKWVVHYKFFVDITNAQHHEKDQSKSLL